MLKWNEVIKNAKVSMAAGRYESAKTEFKKVIAQKTSEKGHLYEANRGYGLCCYLLFLEQKQNMGLLGEAESYLIQAISYADEKTILDTRINLICVYDELIKVSNLEEKTNALSDVIETLQSAMNKKEFLELKILCMKHRVCNLNKEVLSLKSTNKEIGLERFEKLSEAQKKLISLQEEKKLEKNGHSFNLTDINSNSIKNFFNNILDQDVAIVPQERDNIAANNEPNFKEKIASLLIKKRTSEDLYKKDCDELGQLAQRKKKLKEELVPEIEREEKNYQDLLKKKEELQTFLEKNNFLTDLTVNDKVLPIVQDNKYQNVDMTKLLEIDKERDQVITQLNQEIARLEQTIEKKISEVEQAIKQKEQERAEINQKKDKINQKLKLL